MSEPELPIKHKRPGMNFMPNDVPPDHTDHSAGPKGKAVGNVADADGNVGGGGGERLEARTENSCEEFHCNCDSVQGSIDAYNEAVGELATSIGSIKNLQDTLKDIISHVNDKLKGIDAKLRDGDGTNDCNDCGNIKNIEKLINTLLPTTLSGKAVKVPGRLGGMIATNKVEMGNIYRSCCVGGVASPEVPFRPTTPQAGGPCGLAGDSIENSPLFVCDLLVLNDAKEYDTIDIPTITCEPGNSCEEGKPSISLDQQPGGAILQVPKLSKSIDTLSERINSIKKFIDNLRDVTNAEQNVGGANGSLRKEACLSRLLGLACAGTLRGGGETDNDFFVPDTFDPRRYNSALEAKDRRKPWHPCYEAGCIQSNTYGCCHQLMQELANKTLTYGHTGTGEGRGWNDKPSMKDCPTKDIIVGSDWAYVDVAQNQTLAAAAAARGAYLKTTFPGGCDGIQDVRVDPDSLVQCLAGVDDNLNSLCPCASAAPSELDVVKRQKLQLLQNDLANSDEDLRTLTRDKIKAQKLLDEEGQNFIAAVARGAQEIELDHIKNTIQILNSLNLQLTFRISETTAKINILKENIAELMKDVRIAVGAMCVKIGYSYCPATSTPKKGGASETLSGVTFAARTQKNFFDLLGAIKQSMNDLAQEIGCANPIAPHIMDCIGTQIAQGKKDPFPPRRPDDGRPPESKNRGNLLDIDAGCTENDNVAEIESWWYPYFVKDGIENGCLNNLGVQPRAQCVQKLFRIMKNWLRKIDAGFDPNPDNNTSISYKLTTLQQGLGALNNAVKTILKLTGDLNPDKPNACKGWSGRRLSEEIKTITNVVITAQTALENLIQIKNNF